MPWTQADVNEAIGVVTRKATTDRAFRQLVLSEPNAAIKSATGKDVPPGFAIKVIENAPGIDQTYVLPDFRGGELSEADLEQVAGGICGKDMGSDRCQTVICQPQA